MTNNILWDESPYSPAGIYPCFGGTVEKRRLFAARKFPLLLIGFFLGFLSEPEDGGSMFVRTVGELLLEYRTFHPRRCCSSKSPL
jgi:hypothetical protein